MQKFLDLKRDPQSKVPAITQLLSSISGDKNAAFKKIANSLFFSNSLNPVYTLVSLRDIIQISPLNIDNGMKPEELNPVSSFKWLFLIYSLAAKTVSEDVELERGKLEYLFTVIEKYITTFDTKIPYSLQFASGLLCMASRLIDTLNEKAKAAEVLCTNAFYKKLTEILENVQRPPEDQVKPILTSDFSEIDILLFAHPISQNKISPSNVFNENDCIINSSIIRLLLRVLKIKLPENTETLKKQIISCKITGLHNEIRDEALVLLFNGNEKEAFKYSDNCKYNNCMDEMKKFYSLSKSFTKSLSYKESITLSKIIQNFIKIASKRSENWVEYNKNNTEAMEMLCKLLVSGYHQDFVMSAIILMRMGQIKVQSETIPFIMQLLISAPSACLREEAGKLLLENLDIASDEVVRILPEVCNCGSRSETFFKFLEGAIPKLGSKVPTTVNALIESIKDSNESLKRLPNAFIYTQISNYTQLNASYMDPRPCMICNNPEIEPTTYTNNNKSDIKYTHDQILIKLSTPLIIQAFDFGYEINKSSRLPHTIKVYVSSSDLKDPIELLSDKPKWCHVCDLKFKKGQTKVSEVLPLSLYASSVQFHFTDFWEEPERARAQCPMCHGGVPDPRSGICPNCHENIYQCRNCHNINYSHLDGFICPECGFSNFINVNWTITATTSFSNTKIENENDCDTALIKADELMADAHKKFVQIRDIKSKIEEVISPAYQGSVGEKTERINTLYNNNCRNAFNELTNVVQHVCAIRNEVARYKNKLSHNISHAEFNMCYNCRTNYIKQAITFIGSLAKIEEIQKDLDTANISSLLIDFASNQLFKSYAITALTTFCKIHPYLIKEVNKLFINSLPNPPSALVSLLCSLEDINDEKRLERFKSIVSMVKLCLPYLNSSPMFIPLVFQPIIMKIFSSPIIINTREKFIMRKSINAFLASKTRKSLLLDPLEIFDEQTLAILFTKCNSETIRKVTADHLMHASDISNEHLSRVATFINGILSNVTSFTEEIEECFDVAEYILSNNNSLMIHEIYQGFIEKFVDILKTEVNRTVDSEGEMAIDLNVGLGIHKIVDILNIFFGEVTQINYIINKKPEVAKDIVYCYFQLRSLILQRSNHIDTATNILKDFVMSFMVSDFVINDDYKICEEEEEKHEEPPQQEEYNNYSDISDGEYDNAEEIPSASPSRDPVQPEEEEEIKIKNTVGPTLMMHASAKCVGICPEIAIRELCSIIFPVKVPRNVAIIRRKIRSQEDFIPGRLSSNVVMSSNIGPLMKDIKNMICKDLGMNELIEDDHGIELLVNNNIISLDLAIEDVYEKIWEPTQGSTPMNVIFRLQGFDGEATEPMIEDFPRSNNQEEKPEIKYKYTTALIESGGLKELVDALLLDLPSKSVESLLKLFSAFVYVDENVEAMNKMNTVEKLFELMKSLIDTTNADLLETALSIALKLISAEHFTDTLPEQHIAFIFQALEKPLVRSNQQLVGPILALAPLLSAKSKKLIETVLTFFLEKIQPNNGNVFENNQSLFMLNSFAEFTLALPVSQEGNEAREGIFSTPIFNQAIDYLTQVFPMDQAITSPKWMEGVEKPSIPALLKFLAGIIRSFEPAQKKFLENDKKNIHLILALSNVASTANIGEFASNVIESAVAQPSFIANEIEAIQNKITQDARSKAQAEREKAIENANNSLTDDILKMMEQLGDDSEWQCCICKEGVETKTDEPLSVYVYSNRMGDFSNTATHFILVHQSCHSKAKTHDQKGKQTLSEWEAAKVRNCERPCNAMFPLPSSNLSASDYHSVLVGYLCDHIRGSDYFRGIMMDVVTHLRNFARNEPISFACGGGSIPNVVALLPFLVYAGNVILSNDKNDSNNRKGQESKMQSIVQKNEWNEETTTLAIWTLSLEEWHHIKAIVVKALLKEQNANTFEKAKRPLTFFILIDKIMNKLYVPSEIEAQEKDGQLIVSSKSNSQYIKRFEETLLDDPLLIKDDWIELGEEIEDEIMNIEDLRTALIMADINLNDQTPEDWLKNQLQ